ncbi:MAG: hypothetical protein AAB354_04980 [candidate division KSB1 bacterium]
MKALVYRLRLLEPVLIAKTEPEEENSAITASFIPGSAMRGALIARYLQANSNKNIATDDEARRLFFTGDVCFLHAYPVYCDARMSPRPLSWQTLKDQKDSDIFDFAISPTENRVKSAKGEFCHVTKGVAVLHTPAKHLSVHISLNDANRRGESNDVFRYEALAEGQSFEGVVIAKSESDLTELLKLFTPEEIRLGRAHTAGYGRAQIEILGEKETGLKSDWRECEIIPADKNNTATTPFPIRVTLLSDTIVRGANGQCDGDFDAALTRLLGRKVKAKSCSRQMRVVTGYNRKWSLPVVQSWALQAGSVFVYDSAPDFDPDTLRAKSTFGLGERCAEGFGRIAVDWQSQPVLQQGAMSPADVDPVPLSEGSAKLAREMANRRLRDLLERKLVEQINAANLDRLPKNAQLSRVRTATQQALFALQLSPEEQLRQIENHLNDLKGAKQQFENARVNDTGMLKWLQDRLEKKDVQVQLLSGMELPKVAGQTAELSQAVQAEYTARFIDGVMKKAVKQNQEKSNE